MKLVRCVELLKVYLSGFCVSSLFIGLALCVGLPQIQKAHAQTSVPLDFGQPLEVDPFGKVDLEQFKQLTRLERIQILKAYQEFFLAYEAQEIVPYESDEDSQETADGTPAIDPLTSLLGLFSEADAAGGAGAEPSTRFDCYYAGWPSKIARRRGRIFCQSPVSANSGAYLRDEAKRYCKGGQLLCNPALFGEGLCAPQTNQRLRNKSFDHCIHAFDAAKRDLGALADEILSNPALGALYNQMGTSANQVCSVHAHSFQKGTATCRSLLRRLEYVQNEVKKRIGHTVIGAGDQRSPKPGAAAAAEADAQKTAVPDVPNLGKAALLRHPKSTAKSKGKAGKAGLVSAVSARGATHNAAAAGDAIASGARGNEADPATAHLGAGSGNEAGSGVGNAQLDYSGRVEVGSAIACYHALSVAMGADPQKNYPASTLVIPMNTDLVCKGAFKFTKDLAGKADQVELCPNSANLETVGGFFYPNISSFKQCNIDNTTPSEPRKLLSEFLVNYAMYMVDRTLDPRAISDAHWKAIYKQAHPEATHLDAIPADSMKAVQSAYILQLYEPKKALDSLQICSRVAGDQKFKDFINRSIDIVNDQIKALAEMVVAPGPAACAPGAANTNGNGCHAAPAK